MPALGPGPQLIDLGNPVSDHPLNRGLVAWWIGLSNGAGGALWFDLLGRYNLTRSGAAWRDRPGFGAGLLFDDAASDYAENAGAVLTAAPLTMAAWVFPDESPLATVAALGRTGTANQYFRLALASTTRFVNATARTGAGSATSATAVGAALNSWNHVAGVFASDTSRTAYLNGVAGAENTASRAPAGLNVTNVGCLTDNTRGVFFSGQIGDVAIWNRGLSAGEVAALYTEGRAGNPNRLRRYTQRLWSFGGTAAGGAGPFTATAALTVGAATVAGSATHTTPVYTGSAALSAAPATAAGSATFAAGTKTASGALSAAPATLAGSATFAAGTKTASGALAVAPATASGSATFAAGTKTATGALATAPATASGTATHTAPAYTAAGALSVGRATLTGTAIFATVVYQGNAAVTVGAATLSGSGTFVAPVYAASGALTVGRATLTGTAVHAPPAYTATAALTAGRATFTGAALFAGSVSVGTAGLIVAGAALSGLATFVGGTPVLARRIVFALPVVRRRVFELPVCRRREFR